MTSLPMPARGSGAWTGAACGLFIGGAAMWFGIFLSAAPGSAYSWWVNLSFAIVLGIASVLLGRLAVALGSAYLRIPLPCGWLLPGVAFLLFMVLRPVTLSIANAAGIIAVLVTASSLFGAGIGALAGTRHGTLRRRVALGLLLIGGTMLAMMSGWLSWAGPRYQSPGDLEPVTHATPLALADPSQPGDYRVLKLTYGSGTDRRRPEFGEAALIRTPTVDVSRMVRGWSGVIGWLRTRYWGFDLSEAPLNARIWYPDGDGPFPLVLVVHGNHLMDQFSDRGYGYLGELLASRGFIVASVDQNFLNSGGMLEAVVGGLQEENDARAYLLLEHLRLWHHWNVSSAHPFQGKLDVDRIALIGHSRGGEATAVAALFNRLPAHPDHGDIGFDFGYSIRTVIGIAPSDRQYRPRRQATPLENVNYLVLHGAADGDVRSFEGLAQYDRVDFTDGRDFIKAAVYVHGANHGQFNTSWGRGDRGAARWFMNRGPIMPAADQERIATVFISGFLAATLLGQMGYAALFETPLAGRDWLPPTVYLSQCRDANALILAHFDEDLDLSSSTLPGGRISGTNLSIWREQAIALGSGRLRDTAGVYLGWDRATHGVAWYELSFASGLELSPGSVLSFALANISPHGRPIDLTVALRDGAGRHASLPLSHLSLLPPPLTYRMFKPPLKVAFESEPVFSTYALPLASFQPEEHGFDPATLTGIRLQFDRTETGQIILDDLAVRPLPATP